MSNAVRIGLIGCGGISRAHARGYRNLGDSEARVVVTCDEARELAEERARETACETVATDWRAVLDRKDVDAVDLCLPHDLHADVAVAAAHAGKHVLVEKPLATTLADADRMIRAAHDADVRLMCAFCERFDPQHIVVKRVVDEGWLGTPMMARTDHNQNVELPVGHWIREARRLGGGAIASAGCHRLDLLRWFFGEVVDVSSFRFHWRDRMEGEVAGVVILRFQNGALGAFQINWMTRKAVWYEKLWLEGTEGSIHNHGGVHAFSLRRPDWSQGYVALDVPSADPFAEEIRHFLQCVRTVANRSRVARTPERQWQSLSPRTSPTGRDGTSTLRR
jgi:predicted dehydrogenase